MSFSGPANRAYSVAVVGGGIIGLATAWRLIQRGFPVTVYDSSTLGAEASWAGAGMLAPGGEVEKESPLASAAIASRRLYPDFIRDLERDSTADIDYQECGALELAYSETELCALEHRAAIQQQAGIPSKPVNPASVRAFWPRVEADGLAGARFYPEDAIVNPRQVVAALLQVIRRLGGVLLPNCAVREVYVTGQGVEIDSPQGTASYAAAVLAAGAWSSAIKISGVPAIPPCEPVKGHLLAYLQPEQTCTTIVRRGSSYLLQRANGMLVAGASVERVGFDREGKPDIVAALATQVGAILPHLRETTPTESWIGFRPGSDELRVGQWHSNRLYLGYGHYRNGILLAPWTAAVLSQAIASNVESS